MARLLDAVQAALAAEDRISSPVLIMVLVVGALLYTSPVWMGWGESKKGRIQMTGGKAKIETKRHIPGVTVTFESGIVTSPV
jgi:hypothetical protein